jgi:hypothetical protein
MHALLERSPQLRYRQSFLLLKGAPWVVSCARVHRLRTLVPRHTLDPNHVWSDDFGHDEVADRRRNCHTLLDANAHEYLTSDWAVSITADAIVHVLHPAVGPTWPLSISEE